MAESSMEFTKMHGLGNDFVVIDGRESTIRLTKRKVTLIADRRFGIGCDQILVLRKSRKADFRMQIFNSDGSEVEMCGNGIRCLARFLYDKNLTEKKEVRFETLGGIITTRQKGKLIEVGMGMPVFETARVPVNLPNPVINRKLKVKGREFHITCLSMGNPHCVLFVDTLDAFDVKKYGSAIENHKLFPSRTNVEFVEIINKNQLKMKVWERGVGETPACGTGACATAVAARRVKGTAGSVTVNLEAGNLNINWEGEDAQVIMCGPAATVFSGVISL